MLNPRNINTIFGYLKASLLYNIKIRASDKKTFVSFSICYERDKKKYVYKKKDTLVYISTRILPCIFFF